MTGDHGEASHGSVVVGGSQVNGAPSPEPPRFIRFIGARGSQQGSMWWRYRQSRGLNAVNGAAVLSGLWAGNGAMIGDVAHDATVLLCTAAAASALAGGLLSRSSSVRAPVALAVAAVGAAGLLMLRVHDRRGTGRGRPPTSGYAGGPRTAPGNGSWTRSWSRTTPSATSSGPSASTPPPSGPTSTPLGPGKRGLRHRLGRGPRRRRGSTRAVPRRADQQDPPRRRRARAPDVGDPHSRSGR